MAWMWLRQMTTHRTVLATIYGGCARSEAFRWNACRSSITCRERCCHRLSWHKAHQPSPGTKEYLVVVEGAVEVSTKGEAHLLREGDAIAFHADGCITTGIRRLASSDVLGDDLRHTDGLGWQYYPY